MSESLKYELLEAGIHYYTWKANTSESLHTYLQHSHQLILQEKRDNPDKTPHLLVLLNLSNITLPPLKEMVSYTVDIRRQAPFPKDSVGRTVAYLTDDPDLPDKITNIAPLTSSLNKRKFFKTNQKEDAIQWLLEQDT